MLANLFRLGRNRLACCAWVVVSTALADDLSELQNINGWLSEINDRVSVIEQSVETDLYNISRMLQTSYGTSTSHSIGIFIEQLADAIDSVGTAQQVGLNRYSFPSGYRAGLTTFDPIAEDLLQRISLTDASISNAVDKGVSYLLDQNYVLAVQTNQLNQIISLLSDFQPGVGVGVVNTNAPFYLSNTFLGFDDQWEDIQSALSDVYMCLYGQEPTEDELANFYILYYYGSFMNYLSSLFTRISVQPFLEDYLDFNDENLLDKLVNWSGFLFDGAFTQGDAYYYEYGTHEVTEALKTLAESLTNSEISVNQAFQRSPNGKLTLSAGSTAAIGDLSDSYMQTQTIDTNVTNFSQGDIGQLTDNSYSSALQAIQNAQVGVSGLEDIVDTINSSLSPISAFGDELSQSQPQVLSYNIPLDFGSSLGNHTSTVNIDESYSVTSGYVHVFCQLAKLGIAIYFSVVAWRAIFRPSDLFNA